MDFQTLQGHTFRLLRDPVQTRYSLDFVKKWLNDAERQYCTDTDYSVKKSTALTTDSGTREYDAPADCLSVQEVYYGGARLGRLDIEDTIHSDGDHSGPPTGFYVENQKIRLEPIPTAAVTLTVLYYSMGGAMSAVGDVPIIPAEHHMALVFYACMLGCIEGDDTRLAVFNQLWMQAIEKAKADVVQKYPWPAVDQTGGAAEVSRHNHDTGGF